jgi:hypothetical protein
MAMLAETADAVIGVDTHTDTHAACLLDHLGREIAAITIPADPPGCRMLLAWAKRNAPGPRLAWAIEGTRSHGLGLTRYLQGHGQAVIEAGRPPRASKRPGGKSDPPTRPGPHATRWPQSGLRSPAQTAPVKRCGSCWPPGPRQSWRAPPRSTRSRPSSWAHQTTCARRCAA